MKFRDLHCKFDSLEDPSGVPPFSHILAKRPIGYTHHGVHLWNGCVVDFSLPEQGQKHEVRFRTLDDFHANDPLVVRCYDKPLSSVDIMLKVDEALGGTGYNLLFNNCEHVASKLITGIPKSVQVEAVALLTAGAGAVCSTVENEKLKKIGVWLVIGGLAIYIGNALIQHFSQPPANEGIPSQLPPT